MSLIRKKALQFASKFHSNQLRKYSQDPYINHPKGVVKILDEFNVEFELIVTAYLHDVLEDTNATYGEIEEIFGTRIAKLVQELTSDRLLQDKMGKVKYLTEKMNTMSSEALTVKLADRLDNVSGLGKCELEFRERYMKETMEILSGIKRIMTPIQMILYARIKEKSSEYSLDLC
ncbi:MAG: HD domain-containing protein [Promethearchaeota archaeon]